MAIVRVGQAIPRREDARLLAGEGRFVADFGVAGQAHGGVVRSPVAHARIRRIATAAALAAPGVLAVLTAADAEADGLGTIANIIPRRRRDGSPMVEPPYPVLAIGRVRHVGEAVAFVVAETAAEAADAAELVEVDYDELPAVTDAVEAIRLGAPVLRDEVPGNAAFHFERGDRAAVDAAFARARHRARVSIVIPRVASCALETRGAVGVYDAATGRWTLRASVQKPHLIRTLLARDVFRVAEDRIRVIASDVGGSFGTKGLLHPELALVLWAARRLGRPVRWIATRGEAFLSDVQGRDNATTAELALDGDGRFLALRVTTVANLGAYLSTYGTHSSTNNVGGVAGVYTTPCIHVEVTGVFTNTAPTGPYRGAGRPEACFAIERVIDVAACELGIDRVELRRRNMIPARAMPYRTPLDQVYDCGEFERNMDRALALAGRAGFEARREESMRRGRLRGLGVANCIENAGPRNFEEWAEVRIDASGAATLVLGTDSHGQGHETVFAQLASDILRLASERIAVRFGDTDVVARGHGSFGSRSACVGGSALAEAARAVVERARDAAAVALGVAPEAVSLDDRGFRAAGSNRVLDWAEVAEAAGEPLTASAAFDPEAPTFPNGCHVCEVEIDPETGAVALLRYVVVDDVGRVLNPLVVEGQVHGGVAQGIGEALYEAVRHQAGSGQLLTGSFLDYALPRAGDVPAFELETHEVPTAANPLGVKGVGEAGVVGALPAVVNAVCDALAPLGIHHIDMPMTPERVWSAIRRAGCIVIRD